MERQDIINDINYYQQSIYNLQNQIEIKRQKVEDLNEFYNKFSQMDSDVNNELAARQNRFGKVNIKESECVIFKSYLNRMTEVLNGNRRNSIVYNLSADKNMITAKIRELEDEITQLQSQINNYDYTISNLYIQLQQFEEDY